MTEASPGGATWDVTVLTLFPAMFPGPVGQSLAGKALESGKWRLRTLDIREFARDKHRSVDDTPFGGGAGMVLRVDVVEAGLTLQRGQRPAAEIDQQPEALGLDQVAGRGTVRAGEAPRAPDDGEPHVSQATPNASTNIVKNTA